MRITELDGERTRFFLCPGLKTVSRSNRVVSSTIVLTETETCTTYHAVQKRTIKDGKNIFPTKKDGNIFVMYRTHQTE
jgi:hypothetical protein